MTTALKDLAGERASEEPVVSVVITSFNSEIWLGKALDSVLEQQVPFPVEIVIADDCSTDATVALARTYQERFPSFIRLIARPENVGTQRNYYDAFEQSRGKYIAWLDADDYWTDPVKLAVQVKALEADPTLMICAHYVRWVARGSQEVTRERFPALPPGRHGMSSILNSNFLPSPSVVFRSGLQRHLPDWYFDISPITDWALYVVAAGRGDILLVDRLMADYTLNPSSAFWGEGALFWHKQNVTFYDRVPTILPRQLRRRVGALKGKQHEAIAYISRKKGDFVGSRREALKAFRAPQLADNFASKTKALLMAAVGELGWRLFGKRTPTDL